MLTAEEFSLTYHQNWFKALAIEDQLATFEGFASEDETKCASEDTEGKRLARDLIIAVDLDLDGKMNFAEYLLLRRAAVSWVNCAQETMNRAGLRCALALAVPGRLVEQSEADTAFRVGMRLMQSNKFTLSFPVYVLIADL